MIGVKASCRCWRTAPAPAFFTRGAVWRYNSVENVDGINYGQAILAHPCGLAAGKRCLGCYEVQGAVQLQGRERCGRPVVRRSGLG